jgi:hypothetical protein
MLKRRKRYKRSLADTYWILCEYLEEYPSGDIRFYVYPQHLGHSSLEHIYVSHAHEMCLWYLIYANHRDIESLQEVIQSSIRWRKACKELGAPRTKLERFARVSMRRLPRLIGRRNIAIAASKTGLKLLSEGTGIFAPGWQEKSKEKLLKLHRERSKRGPVKGREWIIIDPEGNRFKIDNLSRFCREHNLSLRRMSGLALGYRKDRPGEYSCRLVRDSEP